MDSAPFLTFKINYLLAIQIDSYFSTKNTRQSPMFPVFCFNCQESDAKGVAQLKKKCIFPLMHAPMSHFATTFFLSLYFLFFNFSWSSQKEGKRNHADLFSSLTIWAYKTPPPVASSRSGCTCDAVVVCERVHFPGSLPTCPPAPG